MASTIISEFRAFAVKGNVIDLAVGIIIGGAFGKIVDSLVNDIVMPLIPTLLGGRIDFTNLFIVLESVPNSIPRNFDALKKSGGTHLCLWQLHHHLNQFHPLSICDLPNGEDC